jgi:hypothetical protein
VFGVVCVCRNLCASTSISQLATDHRHTIPHTFRHRNRSAPRPTDQLMASLAVPDSESLGNRKLWRAWTNRTREAWKAWKPGPVTLWKAWTNRTREPWKAWHDRTEYLRLTMIRVLDPNTVPDVLHSILTRWPPLFQHHSNTHYVILRTSCTSVVYRMNTRTLHAPSVDSFLAADCVGPM